MRTRLIAAYTAAVVLFATSMAIDAQTLKPPAPGKTTSLFDGKTLKGWEGDTSIWSVQDGAITGGSLTQSLKVNYFLASLRDYGDFVARFQIKLVGTEGFINSGFQIRSQRQPNSTEMVGYQCDYGDPEWWGGIYDESRRNRVIAPPNMKALGPVIRRNDWNDYVVLADGPRITTWINGVMGTSFRELDPAIPLAGKIAIQIHGGAKAVVQVKNITIEELHRAPAARAVQK